MTMLDEGGTPLHYGAGRASRPHVICKGQGAGTLYYLDADDQQSAWHADLTKARRFASYDSALDVLDLLLEDDLFSSTADDYDILPL